MSFRETPLRFLNSTHREISPFFFQIGTKLENPFRISQGDDNLGI
jgi:hypothetical protein